jgi:hypothetical protein
MNSKIEINYDLFVDTFWYKMWKIRQKFYSDREAALIQNSLYYMNRNEVLDSIKDTINTK